MGARLLKVALACLLISVVAGPLIVLRDQSSSLAFDWLRLVDAASVILVVGLASALVLDTWARVSLRLAAATALLSAFVFVRSALDELTPARISQVTTIAVIGLALAALIELSSRVGASEKGTTATEIVRTKAAPYALSALVLFLAVLPLFASGYWVGMVLETLVYATIAVGLNISVGMAGLLVLGHAAFWAVGAYTFAMLTIHEHLNFWLAFPAAGLAAALAGLVVGLPALRLRGDYLAVCTLGFGETVRWLIKNNSRFTGGDTGIPGSEFPPEENLRTPHGFLGDVLWQPTDRDGCYYFALALAVLAVAAVAILKRSRYGRAMSALREDETAAKCMGINTMHIKLIACMAAAMWAGLAGVVHPVYRTAITPEIFDMNASVLFLAMVVLGGLGSVAGSVLGAAVLWILPALLRNYAEGVQEYRMLVFGAVMAAMMVIRPRGILGGGHAQAAVGSGT